MDQSADLLNSGDPGWPGFLFLVYNSCPTCPKLPPFGWGHDTFEN
jgi:hypothetical protein